MSRAALEKRVKRMNAMPVAVPSAAPPAFPSGLPLPPFGYPGGVMPYAPGAVALVNIDPETGMPVAAPIIRGDDDDFDSPQHKSNALPMHGNTTNYNINSLLYNNIMDNPYFHALYQLRTYHEVIDEIKRSVKHVEPWQTGTSRFPSSAFCLLLKFMTLKLTLKQMNGLLGMKTCPLVRAMGFLYLRYTCNPADLWKWYEPYIEDSEEIQPASDKNISMTIGDYCIKLLTDMQYYGTTLPRIPVPIERKIKVLLLLLDEKKKRRQKNLKSVDSGRLNAGSKVKAIYGDEVNEPAWYDAVVDGQDEDNPLKYWVTFPEYGNSELVDLGDIEIPEEEKRREDKGDWGDKKRSRSRSVDGRGAGRDWTRKDSRSRSRSRDRHRDRDYNKDRRDRDRSRSKERDRRDKYYKEDDRRRDRSRSPSSRRRERSSSQNSDRKTGGNKDAATSLLQKVLESEREASAAVGKNYAQRPASYKGSLSLKLDRYTARKKSPSPERSRRRSRSRSPQRLRASYTEGNQQHGGAGGKGPETSAEYQNKMKALKDRYGDASARST